jgi:hypothetical protein
MRPYKIMDGCCVDGFLTSCLVSLRVKLVVVASRPKLDGFSINLHDWLPSWETGKTQKRILIWYYSKVYPLKSR